MEVVIWLCTFATIVTSSFAAPVENAEKQSVYFYDSDQMDYLRIKRLNSNPYMTPCQAAAAAKAAASTDSLYQTKFEPAQTRYDSSSYGYTYPEYASLYRTDDPYKDDREIMSYSDGYMENKPTARFAKKKYLPTAVVSGPVQTMPSYVPLNTADLVGSGYGVFPNGNVGGCNVPLFFSCTPSISPGRISQVGPVYPPPIVGASPIDFKGIENIQGINANREEQLHDHLVNTPVSGTANEIKEKQ